MTAAFVYLANFLKTSMKQSSTLRPEKNIVFQTKIVSYNYQKANISYAFVKKAKELYHRLS